MLNVQIKQKIDSSYYRFETNQLHPHFHKRKIVFIQFMFLLQSRNNKNKEEI